MRVFNLIFGYLAALILASFVYSATSTIFLTCCLHETQLPIFSGYAFDDFCLFWLLSIGLGLVAVLPSTLLKLLMASVFKLRGTLCYGIAGAIGSLLAGYVLYAEISWPAREQEYTFFEGLLEAAEKQGPFLFFAGLIGGLTYWFTSGRRVE
jgi:hypothetical protein